MSADVIVDEVKAKYGSVAASTVTGADPGVRAVAEAFGYSPEELASIPAAANMGLSCGNPTATANLRPGEVVVDLGCGGGIDVLLAARKVGPAGRAVGIDMTPAMIDRARTNAAQLEAKGERLSVEFHQARMEELPLPDGSVDCLISNCVVNLAPDKPAVFREMVRVLKPGGRVAVSDIALKRELPEALAESVAAYVGCMAGAVTIAEYVRMLTEAGFAAVQVIDTRKDLNAYALVEGQGGCCSPAMPADPAAGLPLGVVGEEEWVAAAQGCCGAGPTTDVSDVHAGLGDVIRRHDLNEYAASVQVYAVKPG